MYFQKKLGFHLLSVFLFGCPYLGHLKSEDMHPYHLFWMPTEASYPGQSSPEDKALSL